MASAPDFALSLARLRGRNGWSQAELAAQAGLSVSTIQSYEQARRVPDMRELNRVIAALSPLVEAERRALLRAAGHSFETNALLSTLRKSRGCPETIWDELAQCRWVSMVTNERKEIVAWNGLANVVGERDLASLPSQMHRSALRMAATDHFAARLVNWDEVVGRLISFLKDEGADIARGETPPYMQAVLDSISHENPEFIERLYRLWLSSPDWRAEQRNVHPIQWRLGDGTRLSFHGVFGDWSDFDGLWSFDWHAADAQTATWVASTFAIEAPVIEPPAIGALRDELTATREQTGMSRQALAKRSGVSASAIAAYELGRRTPSRTMLLSLCQALTLDGYATNRLLRLAGFEEEPSDFARWMCGETPVGVYKGKGALHGAPNRNAIFQEAESLAWPCVVIDSASHIVHANRHARRLLDPSRWPRLPGRPGPHLMQLMVSRQFRERIGNWRTVAGVVLPGRLESHVLGAPHKSSTLGVRPVAEYLRRTDPEGSSELFDVWSSAEGFDSGRRPAVRLEWTTERGDALAFHCVFNSWNAYDPYKAMDLFPADAATFAWLEAA